MRELVWAPGKAGQAYTEALSSEADGGHGIPVLCAMCRRRDGSPRAAVPLWSLGVRMGRDKFRCLLRIDMRGPHLHISRFFL